MIERESQIVTALLKAYKNKKELNNVSVLIAVIRESAIHARFKAHSSVVDTIVPRAHFTGS